MEGHSRAVFLLVVGVVISLAFGVGVGTVPADETFDLTVAGSVDIPSRDVTFEGDSYEVAAVGRVDPGKSVTVSATGPDNETYAVYLYNNDEQIVDTERVTGDRTVTFDTGDLDLGAGTYILTINGPNGKTQAVHPLVVKGYTLSFDAPETATPGEGVTFRVESSQIAGTSKPVDRVEVIIAQGSDDWTLTAEETTEGEYVAETSFNTTGEFRVYAVVRGTEKVGDEQELLGVSDGTTVQVARETATPTPTEESAGGNSGGQGATTTRSATTRTPTPTVTVTATRTSAAESPTSSSTRRPTTTATKSGDEAVTPLPTTVRTTTTGPLRAVQTAALLVLIAALLGRFHRDGR